MARTSLGSKALSVLLAVGLVASLNAPVSAWAVGDDATDTTAVEQSLDPAGGGESENADVRTAGCDASQAVENQSDEAEAGTVTVNDSDSLKAAIAAANDGDTITLGEGEFTTYGNTSPKKSLTFVGAGPNTVWSIGNLNGTANGEGNGDYSFDGCDTIAFKNMTLKSDAADYRGFIRINNTVVENCTIVGKTAYWGFNKAKFSDSTFNAPESDYALWDYSTKEMSFDNCTFNISGKGVNVYVEAGNAGEATRTVAVNNCTVNSTKANKAFLNIKNSTCAYDVMLSGTNTVNGLETNGTTGSALYQVETTEVTETSGKTVSVKEKAADGTVTTLYEVKQASSSVAKVGDTEYATLAEAIAAAKDGQTVTLLTDATEDVAISKSITLDLGGKTLTNTNAGKATISVQGGTVTVKNGNVVGGTSYYNIEVTKGSNANLTLTDVTATAGNTGSSMIDNWGTMTITSGTYTGGLNVVKSEEGSTLSITAGTFTLDYAPSSGYTAVILVYGDTTISGGEFVQTATPKWGYPQVVMTGVVEGYTAITRVTGGHFTNKKSGDNIFHGLGKATSDNFKVSGGTFNKSISEGYCADGFIPTKNADGTYGVKEGCYVAQIGGKKYETLADAIRLAAKGKTIQLLNDITENVTIEAMKQITLDLNGHTLNGGTGNAKAAILNKGNVTITDTSADKTGTIKRDDQGAQGETSYYVIDNNGTMVIDQANVVNNSGIKGSSLIRNGGVDTVSSLTINGGTFEQQNFIAVKNDSNGELTINGGTLTSKQSVVQNWNKAQILGGNLTGLIWTDSWTEAGTVGETVIGGNAQFAGEIRMDVTSPNPSTLKIEGGSLDVTKWTVTNAAAKVNSTIAVSGGTFTAAVPENYCAAGYIPTTNSDGTYSVKEGTFVARVDNVKYDSLQEAINAAKDNSTVRLLADVTLTETAVFPAGKTVHINLVGHNITATGTALCINGKTDIQSTGGTGTIESTGRVAVEVGDNAKVTVYSGTLKGREGAVVTGTSTGATIEIRSKATLIATDNAVIADNSSNREGKPNTILVKGGTLIGGIESEGYIACGIYAPWNDNITVSGGTFNITNGAGIVARAGTAKVTGGTFNCTGDGTGWVGDNKNQIPCAALVFDKAANYPALTDDSQILVSGGTFSTDPAANGATLADGYGATKNDDGMYKVAKLQPVAAIGDVKYDTLGQAITAAQATAGGATIKLLKSIETSSYYEVKGDNPVTIDLNGFNITGSGISGLFYVYASGDLTITGEGAVTAVEDNGAAMAVWVRSPQAKVTLAGGTYKQQINNTEDTHFDLIYVERGTAEITGGKYEAYTPEWTLNCKDEYYKSGEAKITVTGGMFKSFDPANNKAEGAGTSFVPTSYISTDNGDGTYSVKEGKFTVQVTSRTTTSGSPVANVSGGGSDVTYAEGTTVTASAISGYNFVGWFVNEYAGTPYSTDLTCTVKPTDNCTMIAVYEPVSGGKFWLSVTASEFTVNGGAVHDSYLYEQYAIGASVTVNFTGTENFLYWVNASNKVVSTDKSYTFTMGSETALKAVYGNYQSNVVGGGTSIGEGDSTGSGSGGSSGSSTSIDEATVDADGSPSSGSDNAAGAGDAYDPGGDATDSVDAASESGSEQVFPLDSSTEQEQGASFAWSWVALGIVVVAACTVAWLWLWRKRNR